MEDVEGRNLDLLLPYVLFAIRECPQASMGFTPFELLFGQRPGDWMLLLVPSSFCKFLNRWEGPYTVLERKGTVNYPLQQPGMTQLVHH